MILVHFVGNGTAEVQSVNGGGKVDHMGGSIVGLRRWKTVPPAAFYIVLLRPSGTFCRRPLQEHFLTASTRRNTHLFGGLGLSKWNFHRDGPTDCAIGGVSPIYWPLRCQLEIRGRVQFRGRFGMDD